MRPVWICMRPEELIIPNYTWIRMRPEELILPGSVCFLQS